MLEQLSLSLNKATADVVELNYSESEGSSIVISKGNVERCLNTQSAAGSVRTFHQGGVGFCSFNDNNFQLGIEKSLDSAIVGGNVGRKLADINPIVDHVSNTPLRDAQALSLEQKFEFTNKIHSLLLDPEFSSTRVEFRNSKRNLSYLSSQGTKITQTKYFTGMSVSVSMKGDNTLQQAYFSDGTYGGMEVVDNGFEQKIETIKKRVKDLVKAPKVESGTYRVLLNQNLAGVFAHEAFGHMSEADFLADNPELHQKITLGTIIGAEELSITDDGRDTTLCGWCPYDDEGVPASRRELIKNGHIANYLHSRITAHEMNMVPTGNGRALNPFYSPIPRMTNTYIENGSKPFEALLEELWDGIYACDMIGGMTNLETFTFSSAYAYKVEKGKIIGLVRDVVLSGTLFETMKNIIGIGNDLEHHGGLGGCGKAGQNGLPVSTGSPHLLIDKVLIG